jgi:hypothetical protein
MLGAEARLRSGHHAFSSIYYLLGDESSAGRGLVLKGALVVSECPERESASSWVDSYVASYGYSYPWGMLFFPLVGLFPMLLLSRSSVALALTIGVELVLIVAAVRWKTYRVELGAGSVSTVWVFSRKSFALADVDLIQHLKGSRGGQLLRLRHGDRILLTMSQDLEGFDDLVGFFREYARHHHLIFATRDDWGEWTQAGGNSGPSEQP